MSKQLARPGICNVMKKKVTRSEVFLAEWDAVAPWPRQLALMAPHFPMIGPKAGCPPMPLRVYFLQSWYALSHPLAEESLYDNAAMRRLAEIELSHDRIPDETAIHSFWHPMEKHQLTKKLFAEVNAYLADRGVTLRSRTLVDTTTIAAPSCTKNDAKVLVKVEDPFPILKDQCRHVKTSYREQVKNRAHLFTFLTLSDLFMIRRKHAA